MFDFSTLRTYPHEPFETLQADDKCFRIRERKGKQRIFILTEQNGTFVLKYESKTDHKPLEFCVVASNRNAAATGLSRFKTPCCGLPLRDLHKSGCGVLSRVIDATITYHKYDKFLGSKDIFLRSKSQRAALLATMKYQPSEEWTDCHITIAGEPRLHALFRCRSNAGNMM